MMSTKLENLKETLNFLQTTPDSEENSKKNDAKASLAWLYLFYVETSATRPTDADRKAIALSLVKTLKPMMLHIESLTYVYFKKLKVSVLMKRSAVQFLLDNYKDIVIDNQNNKLSKVFEEEHLEDAVAMLDEIIEKHRGESDSDDPDSDRDTTNVPSSHRWWTY